MLNPENSTEKSSKDESLGDKKMTRRNFLKGAGKLAMATAVSGTAVEALAACKPEKKDTLENKVYNDLKKEFEKRNLTDSKVYKEFEGRFGKDAFDNFKKEHNLSDEEAHKRWSSAIIRRADDFIKRAEEWKKYEDMAEKMGIDPKGNLDIENINGKIKINGVEIPKEHSKKIDVSKTKKDEDKILESTDVNTDVY